jgi:histidinol phosphatase-like enzyme (inositol monophosphatase family)
MNRPGAMDASLDALLDFAASLARESGALILRYYRTQLAVEEKPDRSPVTRADKEAEELMRRRIESRFPGHAVLGEEGGTSGREQAELRWVLDPIDGTRAFVHGVPLFGTLIGLLRGDRPLLGIIHLPATGELMAGAEGRATLLNGRPVRVSAETDLGRATLLMTCPATLFESGYGPAFHRLRSRVALVRGWGDCFGHFLVAAGRAEAMLDPVMNLWDVAALQPCVAGAGGRLTDFSGNPALGASALSTNGALHDEVLSLLGRESS